MNNPKYFALPSRQISALNPNKSSEYVGVCWDKHAVKWRADICLEGKAKYLGLFINETDAAQAYQEALSLVSPPIQG